ncbi:hypothetical protein L3X38_002727 [Prunus dulcis]|uniref:Uncharacterized protein n=1 Tax=Prunus dulcis TaxID=3755 RepID=A0AAD4ZLA2_PRUDU|nr:hypothetical protein L3X38_002727 [Prunus dulcis]
MHRGEPVMCKEIRGIVQPMVFFIMQWISSEIVAKTKRCTEESCPSGKGRVSIQEEIHECAMSATSMHVFVSRNFNLHKLGNFLWCTIIGRHFLLGGRLS